jgi:hypothetical protein
MRKHDSVLGRVSDTNAMLAAGMPKNKLYSMHICGFSHFSLISSFLTLKHRGFLKEWACLLLAPEHAPK